jgi:hypothetical protein
LFYGTEILTLNKNIRLKFMGTTIEYKFVKWMLRNFKLRIEIRLIFLTYNPEEDQIQASVIAKQSRIVFFQKILQFIVEAVTLVFIRKPILKRR